MADDLGDKTEAPTPRRRRESRDRGQVAKSQELSAAVLLSGFYLARALSAGNRLRSAATIPTAMCASAVIVYITFFYVVLPIVADQCLVLTRYYTAIMPFVVLILALVILMPAHRIDLHADGEFAGVGDFYDRSTRCLIEIDAYGGDTNLSG